ncbi:AAA family ATPase [Clostridium sp. P21]|uniref:AAA family ATPase n=1 Tax=Clostridium muellerianum TaxID=2716538 RepID=A0A7Y0EL74_9CLOT|nr:RNA ligase family protein [Clostridium muellerianum]NMM64450.1 AAA family ATPase [Clostridium muellerianum]
MERIYKYPRTPHIEGSRFQQGDEDLESIKFEKIKNRFCVLEEKVDGDNCGISFDKQGRMYLQSRGHFLNGGYGETQFNMFKTWANTFIYKLREILGYRYVMYGEWLYAKHTVYYDELNVSPSKDFGKVGAVAFSKAKEYLRRKESFVWNATNLRRENRQKLIRLCTSYGAKVKFVYLEVPYRELILRDNKRERYVPIKVIDNMIKNMDMPEAEEIC